jgi:hypothetical protein
MRHREAGRFVAAMWAVGIMAAILACPAIGQQQAVTPKLEDGLAWYDVRDWGVEGKGWTCTPGTTPASGVGRRFASRTGSK